MQRAIAEDINIQAKGGNDERKFDNFGGGIKSYHDGHRRKRQPCSEFEGGSCYQRKLMHFDGRKTCRIF